MKSAKLGVLGEKLPHTLSPEIHADLFRQQGIEGDYDIYEMTIEEVHSLPTLWKSRIFLD